MIVFSFARKWNRREDKLPDNHKTVWGKSKNPIFNGKKRKVFFVRTTSDTEGEWYKSPFESGDKPICVTHWKECGCIEIGFINKKVPCDEVQ